MVTLGLDPGLARVGYGVVQKSKKNITAVDYGCVTTKKEEEHAVRLVTIAKDVRNIIKKQKPDVVAVEQLFYFKNKKTLIAVSEARGVLLYVCKQLSLPVFEYTPLQVKQALTGYGRASKEQIQKMVATIFKLSCVPKPDDVADALAVGVCHAYSVYGESK